MRLLKRKSVLVPAVVILMLIAAYARKIAHDKETVTGHLNHPELDEISGIAASAIHPGIYYVHNDSGDTSRFFAIDSTGDLKTTYYFKGELNERLGVRDCEDIAVGPGPAKGKSYVYLGDIGDNKANHPFITVYRFDEPALTDKADGKQNIETAPLYLKYTDGPKDAETMMVDPVDQLLYIVSKRKSSVTVYTTPLNYKTNDTVTLTKRCTLHFGGLPPFKWITAGDISKDGGQILLKNYHNVYYWKRPAGMAVWQVMMQHPQKLYYKNEKQGEAIGFTPDGTGYYTTSEGANEPIYYYHLR